MSIGILGALLISAVMWGFILVVLILIMIIVPPVKKNNGKKGKVKSDLKKIKDQINGD